MKSLKENLLGGEAAEQLPRTRREAFVFYGKQQFWKLLICGAFTSLFFVPLLGWLYAMNYVKAQAIAALDVGAADYADLYGQLLLGWSLKTYLVSVPLVMLFFVGLGGLFGLVKRICFYQSSGYGQYFASIKDSWFHFALWGMLFGISMFFLRFNVTFYTVSKFSPIAKGLLSGFADVQHCRVFRQIRWGSVRTRFARQIR